MVEVVERKSMKIRPSGRSTDFISPSFGYGCLYNCSYCYMKRHLPKGLTIADDKSVTDILTEINSHAWFSTVQKPNQTHEKFITYDISCNEDFALHHKYHNWKRIFNFFKDHDIAMGSFATKYVNEKLLEYDPAGKIRIRFSLMPERIRSIVEPGTSKIIDRIEAINKFKEAGYDVHINYSPVIINDQWLDDYEELFVLVNGIVRKEYKESVRAEVIFLTHNVEKHQYNELSRIKGEELLWQADLQEAKISEYGGKNIRYKAPLKSKYISEFKKIHNIIIPWNTIRYIF